MIQHLTILTGASRGLGLAMAQQLLSPQCALLCISRHASPALELQAAQCGATLEQWTLDLADSVPAAQRLLGWLNALPGHDWASVTLINNAGVIPAIAPLGQSDPVELAKALRVGLESPMLLCNAFLQATASWPVPRKVLNISSGLGHHAMASQSAYCAAKAGLDHFTRCMALDEARHTNGALVCALAPGVIETDMQLQLRSADAHQFPDRESFENMHLRAQLSSPADAARRVLDYLERPDFGQKPVADVRA